MVLYSAQITDFENQLEMFNKVNIPNEILEIIASYFDGKTLLNFKMTSKRCYTIVQYVQRHYKPWKKICLKEIPKTYFIDLLSKHFPKHHSLNTLSESQYEMMYTFWLQWQGTTFIVDCIGIYSFLNNEKIKRIVCIDLSADIFLPNSIYNISLFKDKIKEKYLVVDVPKILVHSSNTTEFVVMNDLFLSELVSSHDLRIRGGIKYADNNVYINVSCLVNEYQYFSPNCASIIPDHWCENLKDTMFLSVVHGVIIGQTTFNCVAIHNMYTGLCTQVKSWLEPKYTAATAVFIYTNILFVGTQNSYLLAYRLQCWDDLINLKKNNILFETRLGLSKIIHINILNYKNDKIVIVSSQSSLKWIKIN